MCEPKARARAFTLVEVVVVTSLSGFILLAVLAANLHVLRSSARITYYAEMEAQVRRTLEQLGRDLRGATGLTWNSPSDLTLTVPTLAGTATQVTYAWSAATQSFYLVPGANSAATTGRVVLLAGIPPAADGSAGVTFLRFDRDGNAAATDAATKMIQVRVAPTRRVAQSAAATESIASAVFALRNKPTS